MSRGRAALALLLGLVGGLPPGALVQVPTTPAPDPNSGCTEHAGAQPLRQRACHRLTAACQHVFRSRLFPRSPARSPSIAAAPSTPSGSPTIWPTRTPPT